MRRPLASLHRSGVERIVARLTFVAVGHQLDAGRASVPNHINNDFFSP